jgi:hypothetical protein
MSYCDASVAHLSIANTESQCGLLVAWLSSHGVAVELAAEGLAVSSQAIATAYGI